jgi:hypothetical protein
MLHVSDWVDSLIVPGGLLLVVSPPTSSPSFFYGVGFGKKLSNSKVEVRNIFAS